MIIDNDTWWCPRFFDHIYTHTSGQYAPCCIGQESPETNVSSTTPLEWYRGSEMNTLRDASLNPHEEKSKMVLDRWCHRCIKQENDYGSSYRMRHIEQIEREEAGRNIQHPAKRSTTDYINTGEAPLLEELLQVQLRMFGNTCNLDCYMCQPHASSIRERSVKDYNYHKHISFDNGLDVKPKYTRDLLDGFDDIAMAISCVILQGGEPLYIKKQFEMLDRLIELGVSKNIRIEMNSNMSVLGVGNYNIMDYVDKFRNLGVSASIDGYGLFNDYIRRRSKWNDVVSNMVTMNAKDNIHVDIFSTQSILSVLRHDQLLDWASENSYDVTTFIVDDPQELNPRHLPDPIKEELIAKYPNDHDLIKCLSQKGDPKSFVNALDYIIQTDKVYDTDVFEVYPELKPYYEELK